MKIILSLNNLNLNENWFKFTLIIKKNLQTKLYFKNINNNNYIIILINNKIKKIFKNINNYFIYFLLLKSNKYLLIKLYFFVIL